MQLWKFTPNCNYINWCVVIFLCISQTARRLKLRNIPEYSEMSGGQAIETLAQLGDPQYYDLVSVMSSSLNCNFSFSGIKTAMMLIIDEEEETRGRLLCVGF